ncbi:helix-turn-helix domain-containing protein [Anaeromicropila herbilytica]|uniref:Transcriptional regulator n=1 Tax=Anaeromicropila herbilytica TaxID=2785025 RepID=A0A7R7EI90_9FIRM|nr:helix-turn-helix transcriptional regulator [Anaeromicropila herbilytica]BCN28937.1 transcriptional regulator [Anaeromicropila herbilytica]
MTNKIGENIYKLRKQRNFTQQQLSEILGVSIAAISKWETGSAYPDIELLPKIASIFDVSIDYFFNYHLDSIYNRTIVIDKAKQLSEKKEFSTAISMLKEALLRYPNDIPLKFKLAETMIFSGVIPPSDSEKFRVLIEANKELKEVIRNSKSRELIDESYYLLGMSYINLKEFEKAEEAINQLSQNNHMKTELALMRLYLEKGDINSAIKQFQINVFFSIVQIHTNSLWIEELFVDDLETAIMFYEMAIEAFKAFSNNNSCRFDVHISQFYEKVALAYTKIGDFDKAISSLKLAVKYAQSYDNLQTENDLPQFNRLNENDTGWDKVYNQKLQLWNEIESKINTDYKILYDRTDFIVLISDLKKNIS